MSKTSNQAGTSTRVSDLARGAMVLFTSALLPMAALAAGAEEDGGDDAPIARVLLISVDGLHAADLARYVANHPASTLAQLSAHGRTYSNAYATKPSDSFPGLLAMVTGGTPRSTGVYYDDGYDRLLAPATGPCVAGARVQWKQNLDVTPLSFTTTLDPSKLPRNPADGCSTRVYPHQFPRVNNIFELVKAAGGRTAWADKHPAYEFLNGPSGTGVDELFTPEIQTATGGVVTTNSFAQTMAYDDMKVAAVLNWISGLDHAGATTVGVPTLFGMNFQAVSVGQKLSQSGGPVGGYVDAIATPSAALQQTLDHTDAALGKLVNALRNQGLLTSTLIIVSAKHGNSPVDPASLVRVDPNKIVSVVNAAAPGQLALLSADTGPIIWLKDRSWTGTVAAALEAHRLGSNAARIGQVLSGNALSAMFVDPLSDNRAPDIVLVPILGTVYTTNLTKIADHGGFGEDDTHVALLVANPMMGRKTISTSVETRQIACTVLKALDLGCKGLTSQQTEPSKALPHGSRGND